MIYAAFFVDFNIQLKIISSSAEDVLSNQTRIITVSSAKTINSKKIVLKQPYFKFAIFVLTILNKDFTSKKLIMKENMKMKLI